VGIHGEPGRRRVPLASADAIAEELTGAVLKDLALQSGQEVILLVNGFGGTPLVELYLMVNAARKVLDSHHPQYLIPEAEARIRDEFNIKLDN
jgi:dihydroxyacetone kinase-like protein